MQATHDIIKRHFENLEGVHEVKELIELPNKYSDNVSYFSVKYNWIDNYNYTVQDFNIHWDKNELFVRCEGYFPFQTHEDIIKKVSEYIKTK